MSDENKILEVEAILDGIDIKMAQKYSHTLCLYQAGDWICYYNRNHYGDHCTNTSQILKLALKLRQAENMNIRYLRMRHSSFGRIITCIVYAWRVFFIQVPREAKHVFSHRLWISEVKGVRWCTLCNKPFVRGSLKYEKEK